MTTQNANAASRFYRERAAAYEAFEALQGAIATLQRAITADSGYPALVHALPYPSTTETSEAAGRSSWNGPPLEGQAARDHAAAELGRLCRHADQDPRTVTRAPGVLAASPETLDAAAAVNAAKSAFWEAVQQISPSQTTRARKLNDMIPRISLMQIRREISIWTEKPVRIDYTWAGRTSSTRTLTAGAMEAELAKRLTNRPCRCSERSEWEALIQQCRERLNELPEDEPVAVLNVMAPHVRANVYWRNELENRPDRTMIAAPLPILYPDDGRGPVPIKPLPPFDPEAKSRKRMSQKLEDEPFIAHLRLFRYRDQPPTKASP